MPEDPKPLSGNKRLASHRAEGTLPSYEQPDLRRLKASTTVNMARRGLLTHVLTHFFDAHFCHNSRLFSHRPCDETAAPPTRIDPPCPRAARPSQTGTRVPRTPVCPVRTSFAPARIWSIDPYAKERKVLSADRGAHRVWLALRPGWKAELPATWWKLVAGRALRSFETSAAAWDNSGYTSLWPSEVRGSGVLRCLRRSGDRQSDSSQSQNQSFPRIGETQVPLRGSSVLNTAAAA